MNGFDLSTVTNIYLGSTLVKEVYIGTKLIWPTKAYDYSSEYFTIESLEDNNQIGIVDSNRPSISISTDKQTWTTITPNAAPTYFITLNAGGKVYIKGSNNAYYDNSWSTQGYFTSTGRFNVSGNIMSLIYADDFKNKTTLSSSNYSAFAYMFYNAKKLISAEHLVLPATILESDCYRYMFYGCSSLTTAPQLPATTLKYGCYQYMFYDCTQLTTAPELPATILESDCYRYMFYGCSSLTTAPELPATTLSYGCYSYMFYGCSSLTTAPQLPATTLIGYCYQYMFYGCSSLNYIKMLATDVSATDCLTSWVTDVASSGTFVKDASVTLPTGENGIPNGWTIENVNDYSSEYFTIESLEDNNQIGIVDSDARSISISTDKRTWTTVTPNAEPTYFITLNVGGKVYIKGSNNSYKNNSWPQHGYFTSTGQFNVSGNIMSLIYADDFKNKTTLSSSNDSAFSCLFYNAKKLISAEHLVLPATTLVNYCYNSLFQNCSSLTTAPELPATTLAYQCYSYMFAGCTSLTTAPELPATTLANVCYAYMFSGCTSLTTAPELSATTLANDCYYNMFQNCSSLTTAPEWPATTLSYQCYTYMYAGCTSLTRAP